MIIVKLIGGLGNQMFQYAFGRSLALKNNTNLKIDIQDLQNKAKKKDFTLRNFELNVFNVHVEIASESEIQNFMKSKTMMLKDLLTLSLPFKSKNFYLREPHHHYFPLAKNVPANTYAYGYFQSEKYFIDIRPTLLKDFTPRLPLSKQSQEVADRMSKVNGVSIHVRRGDYVSNLVNLDVHGLCEADYYERALSIITEKVDQPKLFVFSDEPNWFKENIKCNFPVEYIEHNIGNASYEDLYLMSLCKHHIIANSSFSWWGAWLNQNPNKIVIAPSKWMNNTPKNTKDVVPDSWIKI